jgi:SAM-dependent methyltransferase
VVISDFSAAMVSSAERHAAELGLDNIECRVLDAEHLDLPDDHFDAVVCRWGYMLMAEPGQALKESCRVLHAGGRLSCAVFAAPPLNPWASIPAGVLQAHGQLAAPGRGAPGIFALADPDRLRSLFAAAGFDEPTVEEVAFTLWFDDADDYWQFLTGAAGAIAVVLKQLEPAVLARVRSDVAERLSSFQGPRGVELPALSLVASAVSP